MWILYAIFIFSLLMITTYHHASQHDNRKVRIIMQITSVITSLLIVPVAAVLYFLSSGTELYSSQYFSFEGKALEGFAIFAPLLAGAYCLILNILFTETLKGKTSTLNDKKNFALCAWGFAALSVLSLPAVKVSCDDIKLEKYVSFFGLMKMLKSDSIYFIVALMLFLLPAAMILINFIVPVKEHIWLNLAGMTAHCFLLGIFSKAVSVDYDLGMIILWDNVKTKDIDTVNILLRDKPDSISISMSWGANISVLLLIFLCAWLSVSSCYYGYYENHKIASHKIADPQANDI